MYMTIAEDSDATDSDGDLNKERQLSDNVLVIEISGPEVHGMSVIDFPGFVHSKLPHL